MVFEPEETEYIEFSYKMSWEHERLKTFKKWIFSDNANCSATKLAEAGFYFCGNEEEPDSVQCFLCKKCLDGWEETDDPWKEHLSHASCCRFAKTGKSQRQLTPHEVTTFGEEVMLKCIDKVYDDRVEKVKQTYKQLQKELNSLKK